MIITKIFVCQGTIASIAHRPLLRQSQAFGTAPDESHSQSQLTDGYFSLK